MRARGDYDNPKSNWICEIDQISAREKIKVVHPGNHVTIISLARPLKVRKGSRAWASLLHIFFILPQISNNLHKVRFNIINNLLFCHWISGAARASIAHVKLSFNESNCDVMLEEEGRSRIAESLEKSVSISFLRSLKSSSSPCKLNLIVFLLWNYGNVLLCESYVLISAWPSSWEAVWRSWMRLI